MTSIAAQVREISDSSRRVRAAEEARRKVASSGMMARLEADAYLHVTRNIDGIAEDTYLPLIRQAALHGETSTTLTLGYVSSPRRWIAHHKLIDLLEPISAATAHVLPGYLRQIGFRVSEKTSIGDMMVNDEYRYRIYLVVKW